MKVRVQFFGYTVEVAGCREHEVDVFTPTVAAVADALAVDFPKMKSVLYGQLKFAVGTEYAERDAKIQEGDVVSLIPPVGGG